MSSSLDRASAAYDARSWDEAAHFYAEADATQPLAALDLERWGLAAYLRGRDEESDSARERAHYAYAEAGQIEDAARVAQWLGIALSVRGEQARGGAWFGRIKALLDEHGLTDSVWQLFVRVSHGMMLLFSGNPQAAVDHFTELLADSERYDDADLAVTIRNGLGQSLVATGRFDEGMRLIDEVMIRVTTDDRVAPQVVGRMYCAASEACRRCLDLDRAGEWTAALDRWCSRQSGLVPYRGQCLVHRAEVLALHGSWPDANAEIDQVLSRLHPDRADLAEAMAHYQRGELHRLRGETDKAEVSYREASRCGMDPQPGLALLRLAQGRTADAHAASRRAIDEVWGAHDRLRMLPAYVDVTLACGDVDSARSAAAELRARAQERDVAMLPAATSYAEGRIALHDGQPAEALRGLREAL